MQEVNLCDINIIFIISFTEESSGKEMEMHLQENVINTDFVLCKTLNS